MAEGESNSNDKIHEILDKVKRHEKDCGSPEVQIARLTERINRLTKHFSVHKHDHSSKRGMMKLINRRRKLLSYLAAKNRKRYTELISYLGLRK